MGHRLPESFVEGLSRPLVIGFATSTECLSPRLTNYRVLSPIKRVPLCVGIIFNKGWDSVGVKKSGRPRAGLVRTAAPGVRRTAATTSLLPLGTALYCTALLYDNITQSYVGTSLITPQINESTRTPIGQTPLHWVANLHCSVFIANIDTSHTFLLRLFS